MGGRGARKCQGLKMDGGGGEGRLDIDWCTPLLPQEPIHFCVCTLCAGLNEGWGGGWNGVSTEASPTVHSLLLSLFFFFFFFWMIHPDCHVRCDWMNEWPGRRLYVWASLLIRCSGRVTFWEWGLLLLSIHGGENWSMRVPDLGFLMCGERAAQMACADRMFWVPLLAGLSHPASACVPVQLAPLAWHNLTWNYSVWGSQTIGRILHWPVVAVMVWGNQSLRWMFCLNVV